MSEKTYGELIDTIDKVDEQAYVNEYSSNDKNPDAFIPSVKICNSVKDRRDQIDWMSRRKFLGWFKSINKLQLVIGVVTLLTWIALFICIIFAFAVKSTTYPQPYNGLLIAIWVLLGVYGATLLVNFIISLKAIFVAKKFQKKYDVKMGRRIIWFLVCGIICPIVPAACNMSMMKKYYAESYDFSISEWLAANPLELNR